MKLSGFSKNRRSHPKNGKKRNTMKKYYGGQHYSTGTHKKYKRFSSRNLMMGNGPGGLESASRILMKGSGIREADSDDRGVPPSGGQSPDRDEIPTEENPVVEYGDEIRINIENAYNPDRGSNPIFERNPVSIYKYYDFHIDKDGNFYINYTHGHHNYGHIGDENNFIVEPGHRVEQSNGYFRVFKTEGNENVFLNFGVNPVNMRPGKIIKDTKTTGRFETPGLPLKKYEGKKITPVFFENDSPYTMDQIKEYLLHGRLMFDINVRTPHAAKRLLNLGLYIIYAKNTGKMYAQYEFINAVFTDPRKKTKGYLVFKKGEPMRKRELSELSPLVEDLKLRPYDNPTSAFGTEYREHGKGFESRNKQEFLEGDSYAKVLSELKRDTRNGKFSSMYTK
jgi:hypothetical protein